MITEVFEVSEVLVKLSIRMCTVKTGACVCWLLYESESESEDGGFLCPHAVVSTWFLMIQGKCRSGTKSPQ
jgi:hypothetical protein